MSYQLPSPQKLYTTPIETQKKVLDHLFEQCSSLQNFLLPKLFKRPYESYKELIEQARYELLWFLKTETEKSKQERVIDPVISEIIAAHPRLGAQKKGATLSEHSSKEQASLAGSTTEAEKLEKLNELYEKKFPGLRYVVFVNGRSRAAVMENMEMRIKRGDIDKERSEAFNAMCDIALDRAGKLAKL